jgi:hypothetical protein
VGGGGCCLGRPSRGRRVVARARLIHGLVEGRVGVGSWRDLTRIREEDLVVVGILGRVEMVFCLTRLAEVREAVDRKGALRLVVDA